MKPKNIYILGSGRSGSTVLDIVLNSSSQVFGGGELINLLGAAWLNDEYCSCGTRASSCQFWSKVRSELLSQRPCVDFAAMHTFQEKHLRSRLSTEKAIFGAINYKAYPAFLQILYDAIREISGKPVILDSSKIVSRAALMCAIDSDTKFIHLTRDVRGVAWSLKRSFKSDIKNGVSSELYPQSIIKTALSWSKVNLQCESLKLKYGATNFLHLRYEDLVKSPIAVCDRIASFADIDLTSVKESFASDTPISTGHAIAGNRLRMNRSLRLVLDEQWKRGLTDSEKRNLRIICGPVMKLYGYK